MTDHRLARTTADVAPRFRCLVCRRFVTGGADGTCPRCGWEPPHVTLLPPRRDRPSRWKLVAAATVLALAAALLLSLVLPGCG